jgi:hypothetical protein
MASYESALKGETAPRREIGAARTVVGTINAAIVAFYKSNMFTKNKPITQRTDRNILEAFRAKHGDRSVALMERKHVQKAVASVWLTLLIRGHPPLASSAGECAATAFGAFRRTKPLFQGRPPMAARPVDRAPSPPTKPFRGPIRVNKVAARRLIEAARDPASNRYTPQGGVEVVLKKQAAEVSP